MIQIVAYRLFLQKGCKDECLPEETNRRIVDIISDVNLAYSEHARRYLAECGLPKERTYVTGSPMAEVLSANLAQIEASDVLEKLKLEPKRYMLLSAHREENIDTEENFESLFSAIKACFVLAGIDEKSLLQAVSIAVELEADSNQGIPVPDYRDENVSTKVVKLIQSYTGIVNKMVWRKVL